MRAAGINSPSAGEACLVGLILLSIFATVLHFFLPLEVCSVAVLALGLVLLRSGKLKIPANVGLVALAFVPLAWANFNAESFHDIGLYHLPMIKWNVEEKLVLGVANLNPYFGYNNVSFLLSALFWLPGFGLNSAFVVNSLFALAALLFLIHEIESNKTKANQSGSVLFALFFLTTYFLFHRNFPLSTYSGTDYLASLMVYLILYLNFSCLLGRADSPRSSLTLFLSFFALTVKLSTLPILLVTLITLWLTEKRKMFRRFLTISLLFLPWIIRNVGLSGCFLFPAARTCLPLPWSVPKDEVSALSQEVRAFVIDPLRPPAEVLANYSWAGEQLKRIASEPVSQISLLFLTLALILILFRRKKGRAPTKSAFLSLLAFTLFGMAFCFFTAPGVSYAHAYILSFGILALVWALTTTGEEKLLLRRSTLILALATSVLWMRMGKQIFVGPSVVEKWPQIPQMETVQKKTPSGLNYREPKTRSSCWGEPRPCSAGPLPHDIKVGNFLIWSTFESPN